MTRNRSQQVSKQNPFTGTAIKKSTGLRGTRHESEKIGGVNDTGKYECMLCDTCMWPCLIK